ncbi:MULTISPECIES: hypothetical protein [unclassified Bartonella]|uniref:hypothetical protein n=1 Tax=unclassified Bartonella TaxID=2645622 RepID=UPI0015FC403B|nr:MULTISPECIES: hypothetical protein [unclassified Bartonella]UXN03964.1 hypothetical protein N6B01_02685 [Bartonella sp. HY406]UXN06947.1 hypothetical protein N6A79_02750 [Bartonella sp. HY761]
MGDLDKALADISFIRQQMATTKEFRGLGPMTMALTAILAFITGGLQYIFPQLAATPFAFFSSWIVTAIIATLLVGGEMIARSRRHHQGMADEMVLAAMSHLLPAGIIGALLLTAFAFYAPDLYWLLPPLWLMLVGCCLFAALRILPPSLAIGAAAYVVLGFATFIFTVQSRDLSPLAMALPFGCAQSLMAFLLYTAKGKKNA